MKEVHLEVTTSGMTDSSKPMNLAANPDLKMAIGQGRGDDCPHQRLWMEDASI